MRQWATQELRGSPRSHTGVPRGRLTVWRPYEPGYTEYLRSRGQLTDVEVQVKYKGVGASREKKPNWLCQSRGRSFLLKAAKSWQLDSTEVAVGEMRWQDGISCLLCLVRTSRQYLLLTGDWTLLPADCSTVVKLVIHRRDLARSLREPWRGQSTRDTLIFSTVVCPDQLYWSMFRIRTMPSEVSVLNCSTGLASERPRTQQRRSVFIMDSLVMNSPTC